MIRPLCVAAVCLWFSPASGETFVANSYGVEGRYQVFTFSKAGVPRRRVSGLHNAAWPSAIRIGRKVHVFASVLRDNRWSELRRWTSTSGGAFRDHGTVLNAGSSEPHGIGPATVTYDGKIFRAYYLVRGKAGPGYSVGLATSKNGSTFRKAGIVYTADSEAAGGLGVSYACTDSGVSYLFLHAYAAGHTKAISVLATSKSPDGPYVGSEPVLKNSEASGHLTGRAGENVATFIGKITAGRPVVILDDASEAYVVRRVSGSKLHLDRPLPKTYEDVPFADFLRSKADLSFVAKDQAGAWRGAVTGYGQFDGVKSEYTAPVVGPSISGPWKTTHGYFASPYFPSGKFSTENPEPIQAGSACTMSGL